MEPARQTVYRPHHQYPRPSMFLVIKTRMDPAAAASSITDRIRAVDPSQPVADISTMQQRFARNTSRARTTLMLAAALGVLALTLATIGLYGVLTFAVVQRRREFGVRMSLGATPSDVQRLVLKEGLALTFAGIAMGALGAAGLASAVHSVLYRTGVLDVRQYAFGVCVIFLCSVAALWIPARRASAADPSIALKAE
jgi:ABC-type antimicrobial peptide transport system permease subunit